MSILIKSIVAAAVVTASFAASAATNTVLGYDAKPGQFTTTSSIDAPFNMVSSVKISVLESGVQKAHSWGYVADELGIKSSAQASFAAYCIDPIADLTLPGNYSYVDVDNADYAKLFQVAGFNGNDFYNDGVKTSTQTVGLQIALWEVSKDGLAGANLSLGDFSVIPGGADASVLTQANAYLTAAKAAVSTYNKVRIYTSLADPASQPLVTTVPEPSTYALIFACLGVVGLVSRRKSA